MKICIDPGHGGSNTGAVAPDGTQEKDVTLRYGAALMAELEERGHDIIATRMTDAPVSLRDRAGLANEMGADCLVSIHANANSDAAVHGAWVIYDNRTNEGPGGGVALARHIFRAIDVVGLGDDDPDLEIYPDHTAWVGDRDGDGEWDDLTVISATNMPAVLVELGFLTNTDDLELLLDPEILADTAGAIADGIEAWEMERAPIEIDLAGDETPPSLDIDTSLRHSTVEALLQMPPAEIARPEERTGDFLGRVLDLACEEPYVKRRLGWARPVVCWAVHRLLDVLTQD